MNLTNPPSFEPNLDKRTLLTPSSPEESELWKDIDMADVATRTILKRLNRFMAKQFPNSQITTISSCSGHVQKNGKIAYEPTMPEYANRKRERNPHIFFSSPAHVLSPEQKQEVQVQVKAFLEKIILKTNTRLNKEGIRLKDATKLDPEEVYGEGESGFEAKHLFKYYFEIGLPEEALVILQTFWQEFENSLSEKDGLQLRTDLTLESFKQGMSQEGFVTPE